MTGIYFLIFGSVVAALVFGIVLINLVLAKPSGSAEMQKIAKAIQVGAAAYLKRQYRTVAMIAVVIFILLWSIPRV